MFPRHSHSQDTCQCRKNSCDLVLYHEARGTVNGQLVKFTPLQLNFTPYLLVGSAHIHSSVLSSLIASSLQTSAVSAATAEGAHCFGCLYSYLKT